jgi:lipid-A-disaccharide synthase-like uncharacterized protein
MNDYGMIIILLMGIHFVADFLFQTDKMAINKSKSTKWLLLHCFIYAVCFIWAGILFAWILFFSHFFIDFITSRINAKLYLNHRHWFFSMIGFDQFLHASILIIAFNYLMRG